MITDGMLYTGALKSRQSLHMTADLDPTEVREHISKHPLQHLKKDGTDSGNPVDIIKGDVHIARTYGERYQWREGVDFNYGLNATYNFGQQYVENHADETPDATKAFPIPGLDNADSKAAGKADDSLQTGLADDQKAGLVQKNFGNQYIYDEGITRTWAAGPNANGPHKEINFCGRYIENQLTATSGDPDPSGINGIIGDQSLAIKTVGDEARYNEGVIDIHHKGDMLHKQTGNHISDITGDTTTTITSDTAKVEETISGGAVSRSITGASKDTLEKMITGDITETINSATKIAVNITAAVEYNEIITSPIIKQTRTGNSDWLKSAENQVVVGACFDTYLGGKVSTTGGAVNENFGGVKLATYAGPKIDDKKIYIRKSKTKLDKEESVLKSGKIGKFGYKLTFIG